MAITTIPNLGPDPFTVNASVLNGKVDPLATDYNGNIDNTNIATAAAIANSKLNLSSIAQAVTQTGGLTISTVAQTMTLVPIDEAKGTDIASATTPNLTTALGNFVHITGTTTITGFATAQAGARRILVFDGILTFTHNSTSLILPTGANITTAAGDTAVLVSEGSGNWRCTSYQRKDGSSLAGSSVTPSSQSQMEAATDNTTTVTPLAVNWHPGVAKAWCSYNETGTPAMNTRYNFDATITQNATGDCTIAITTDFSSAVYCIQGTVQETSGINFGTAFIKNAGQAAGTIRVRTTDFNNGDNNYPAVYIACFGDQ